MEKKTAIIYARQSFGLEEGSASIDVQIKACQSWCSKQDITVIGVYQDSNCSSELYPKNAEGVEASRVDRGFQNWRKEQRTQGRKEYKEGLGLALDEIKKNRPTYIVVYTSNRLGRSATNSNLKNFLTSYLMEYNCSIVEAQTGAVQDFSDKIMMAFQTMRDALDYMGVAEKRKASMASVARRKDSFEIIVNNGYGVTYDRTKKEFGFDAEKAEVVRYIFDATISGAGVSQILAQINKQYKHLAKGRQFYNTNVSHILKNVIYCGYTQNTTGEIAKATNVTSPIVSFSTWQKANEIYKAKKAGYQKWNLKENKKIHWLPYSGFLKCHCGRRLMVVLDGGTVYACQNAGEHVNRLRINALNHGQDFYLTMQALFILNCIKSRKALEASKLQSNLVDDLKSRLASSEASLKAKFRLIESDEDYNFFKDEINGLKRNISDLKQQILLAEEEKSVDVVATQERLDKDFSQIMSPKLLQENDYQRLLQATIQEIVVESEKVKVVLTDGQSFELPRIKVDGRGKKVLPWSEIYASTESVEDLDAITHYDIFFHDGNTTEEKVLLDGEGYTIWLTK